MTCAGLDLSAARARAVIGGVDGPPTPVALEETGAGLPLAVSLHGRRPEVGWAAMAWCREYPHLVCLDFLAHLGTERCWSAGRHRLDAAGALSLVLGHVQPALAEARGVVLVLPAYLSAAQATQALRLGCQTKLPVLGSVAAPLAAGLAAYRQRSWTGPAVLVDVDDHALTWTILHAGAAQLQVQNRKTLPRLSLRAWHARLLDAIADLCIRQSRRDPRDSGATEQLLYNQLEDVCEAGIRDQLVEVIVRASTWCQNLILQPRQIRAFCTRLLEEATEEAEAALAPELEGSLLILTAAAERLPGLAAVLTEALRSEGEPMILGADAAARMALVLADSLGRALQPAEHLSRALPLASAGPSVAGGAAKRSTPKLADL
jgi:hypothetical protein